MGKSELSPDKYLGQKEKWLRKGASMCQGVGAFTLEAMIVDGNPVVAVFLFSAMHDPKIIYCGQH
jgi:hypothetical protein